MKITKKVVEEIQLTLTKDEASWLKGYMQNPQSNPNDPGCYKPPMESEDPETKKYREKFFLAL